MWLLSSWWLTTKNKFSASKSTRGTRFVHSANKNAWGILVVGFNLKKKFLSCDFDFIGGSFYDNVVKISRYIRYKTSKAVFGFAERSEDAFSDSSCSLLTEPLWNSDSIGKCYLAAVQTAAAFASTFPHIFGTDHKKTSLIPSLIPCAIDQDPYFRVARSLLSFTPDSSQRSNLQVQRWAPPLTQVQSSWRIPWNRCKAFIYFTSSIEHVLTSRERKINKYAFSAVGTPPKNIVTLAEILKLTLHINISASLPTALLSWELSE